VILSEVERQLRQRRRRSFFLNKKLDRLQYREATDEDVSERVPFTTPNMDKINNINISCNRKVKIFVLPIVMILSEKPMNLKKRSKRKKCALLC
jgi:hypothetical protein